MVIEVITYEINFACVYVFAVFFLDDSRNNIVVKKIALKVIYFLLFDLKNHSYYEIRIHYRSMGHNKNEDFLIIYTLSLQIIFDAPLCSNHRFS